MYKHGISFFHELKYPANFSHFDYINPNAPKGACWFNRPRGTSIPYL